jgi:multidrug efflux pump subunit AcrB
VTVSLVAVFNSVLFMGGILAGCFANAITISVAILVSGIVSLTLTPMLAQALKQRHSRQRRTKIPVNLCVAVAGIYRGIYNAFCVL